MISIFSLFFFLPETFSLLFFFSDRHTNTLKSSINKESAKNQGRQDACPTFLRERRVSLYISRPRKKQRTIRPTKKDRGKSFVRLNKLYIFNNMFQDLNEQKKESLEGIANQYLKVYNSYWAENFYLINALIYTNIIKKKIFIFYIYIKKTNYFVMKIH